MSVHDQTYNKGMTHILNNGVVKSDRTGVGTISVTGLCLRYDLSDGRIPLLTNKNMLRNSSLNHSAIVKELRWFLSGSGSNKHLVERGVKFWTDWATEQQHLGPLYGFQWRKLPALIQRDSGRTQQVPNLQDLNFDVFRTPITQTEIDTAKNLYSNCYEHVLYKHWVAMLDNVGNGFGMDLLWLSFDNFAHDCEYIPGYHNVLLNGYIECVLSCKYFNTTYFGRNSCAFIPVEWVNEIELIDSKDTKYFTRPLLYHDQLADVIDGIKNNPFSRRHLVNSWNVSMLSMMQLPPCHFCFEFVCSTTIVDHKEVIQTSLMLIMRSNDYCLGNPFNIAQYSLILRTVCELTKTTPGELVLFVGDAHIYLNHVQMANHQLLRADNISIGKIYVELQNKHHMKTEINYRRFDAFDYLTTGFVDVSSEYCQSIPVLHYKIAV